MDKAFEMKESEYRLLNIPIKYICISSTSFYPVVNEELQLLSNKIKFPGISNKGTKIPSSIEISRSSIQLVQYSKVNKLLRVTIQSDTYSKYFSRDSKNEELFKDSIWFCLRIDTTEAYTSTIENLRSNYFSLFIVTVMPQRLYENFTICVKSLPRDRESVISASLPEIELSVRFKDIKISDMSRQCATITPRKRLKRHSVEMPITIKIKRSREQPISNNKLLYQPSATHSIEIREHDLSCLLPRKYLNDNIIHWYLTCIYHEILTDTQRQVVHFFNVFFYTKLIGTVDQQKVDSAESRHCRVSKWTKKVDIFSKDFLVIPVIVNKHWFLVIVCYPWMAGMVNYIELFNKDGHTISNIPPNDTDFATDIRHRRCAHIENSEGMKPMPCILVFDSILKQNRSGEVNLIRDYLKSEWDSKRKSKDGALIFDKSTCRGYSPVVTKQDNNFDCGLYLLQYVESFFKNPLRSYEKCVFESGFQHWFTPGSIATKRDFIMETIRDKSVEIPHHDHDDDEVYIL